MKRILHVANFNSLRLKGCFQCGFPVKISNGLIKNGYEVINYADRDLCRMFGFGHMNQLGRYRLNKHLINFCKTVKPDAILIGHADTIKNETLAEIKNIFPSVPIMQWNCDSILPGRNDRNIHALKQRLPLVDFTMISTADEEQLKQLQQEGKPVAYLPNMVDKAIETGMVFSKENTEYDVMLTATTKKRQFCGKDVKLVDIIDEAEKQINGLKWLLGGIKGLPTLNGCEYLEAFQKSAMGFNLSRYNDIYLYTSDRLAHIMGNGQLALIDRRTGFEEILGKNAAGFYTSEEEFYDLLKHYKNNPQSRMKTAEKGYQVYHSEFNNVFVTRFMADLLFGNFKNPEKPWQIVI